MVDEGDRTAYDLALRVVQELWLAGVRDVVLAPGSRSAPLALVLHAADAAGDLRLHVRVDERSAGFLALGLTTGSRRPVAVVTTSGTAVGNLLPAVMEAHHTGRRLVVVSADRPDRLRGTGANQTAEQAGIFGVFAPCHDLTAGDGDGRLRAAVAAAGASTGPTQLNLQLDGSLLPPDPDPATWWRHPDPAPPARLAARATERAGEDGSGTDFAAPATERAGEGGSGTDFAARATERAGEGGSGTDFAARATERAGEGGSGTDFAARATERAALAGSSSRFVARATERAALDGSGTGFIAPATEGAGVVLSRGPRTVVVAGDGAGPRARLLAESANWPLIAEPTSGARIGRQAIRTGRLLLTTDLRGEIERVVVIGHPTLSRPVTELLSDPGLEVLAVRGPDGVATDPGRVATVLEAVPTVESPDDSGWFDTWREVDDRLGALIDTELPPDSPLAVASVVGRAVVGHATLVVGSSNPVRDLDVMAVPWPPLQHRFVVGNRGLAGIDGVVSTAVGVALGRSGASRTIAYLGDLTFLHDANGLLIGPGEPRPDLTLVVLSDDGGAIFSTLEQGDQRYASAFERVFGTPHGTDLKALCAAHHTAYERVTDLGRLSAALDEQPSGIRVLEVPVSRVDRRGEAGWLRDLAQRAASRPGQRG